MYLFNHLKPEEVLENGLAGLAATALERSRISREQPDRDSTPTGLLTQKPTKRTKQTSKRVISPYPSRRAKPRSQRLREEDQD
jgi:hypothetical protein